MSKKHPTPESFKFAFQGIKTTFDNEPNFKIQLLLGFFSIILGITLKITNTEWLILSTVIFMVLLLELINSSIEALVDLISPERNEKAKIAKKQKLQKILQLVPY